MGLCIGLWMPLEAGAAEADEEVLWWIRSADDDVEQRVIQGIDEGLGESDEGHVRGRQAMRERLDDEAVVDQDCLTGRERCGKPRAMIMRTLGVDLWIAADVEAMDDGYKGRYEVVDRRGEAVATGTIQADQAEGVGLGLVSEIVEAVAVISVSSHPEGAELWIDGEAAGATPVSRAVPVGERHLRLAYEGAEDWEERRSVEAGQYLEVEVAMRWRPATVRLEGAPDGALLYLDGQRVEVDEEGLAVEPGRRFLVVEAAGYESERRHIEVAAEEELVVDLEMERQMGWLRDVDAEAIADRRFQGEIGLEFGLRRSDIRGDTFETDEGPALVEGWEREDGEVSISGRGQRLAPGPGIRAGVGWEGRRLGVEWISLTVARHRVTERLRWRQDEQAAGGRSRQFVDLDVRPMQLRGRWFYENLAIRAQGGLGLHAQWVSLTTDDAQRLRYRRYQPQLNVEAGARYHFDERWSLGAYYRPTYGFRDGMSHHLGITVGGGLTELPGLRSRPPGEL